MQISTENINVMESSKKQNQCCFNETNIVEIDGTLVCQKCGKVCDMVSYGTCEIYPPSTTINPTMDEFCHRLHIDPHTQNIANEIYEKIISTHKTLRKRILIPTSIYIAAKKNFVPRTLKEVSGASGVDTRKIGEYEKIISKRYYRTTATQYVYRLGSNLGLQHIQIQSISKHIKEVEECTNIQNPVLLCAVYIYEFMKQLPNSLIRIQEASGIPSTTLKHAHKKEFVSKNMASKLD